MPVSASEGAGRKAAMLRLTRFFVPAVNVAVGVAVAMAAVACNVHHVSVMHEVRRDREALCAARLDVVRARHAFMGSLGDVADKCLALSRLTGTITQ